MTKTACSFLPKSWQQWMTQALARGCTPESIVITMSGAPGYDRLLVLEAIEEVQRSRTRQPRPRIDTSTNAVELDGRRMPIVFSLATPRIVLLDKVLDEEECDALCAYSKSRLEPAAMPDTGATELIDRITQRLALLVDWPQELCEPLQVARVPPGDLFREHVDFHPPTLPHAESKRERGARRTATILLYLCDVEEGGVTTFHTRGLEVHPRKGCGLFFTHVDPWGAPECASLHSGMPVVSGVKYVATQWMREGVFVPAPAQQATVSG